MTEKHRWYDVIVAWANGEKIQTRPNVTMVWGDFIGEDTPKFNNTWGWRIKPKTVTKRYRMALVRDDSPIAKTEVRSIDITDSCIDDPIEYNIKGFLCWVGDTTEVEVEV